MSPAVKGKMDSSPKKRKKSSPKATVFQAKSQERQSGPKDGDLKELGIRPSWQVLHSENLLVQLSIDNLRVENVKEESGDRPSTEGRITFRRAKDSHLRVLWKQRRKIETFDITRRRACDTICTEEGGGSGIHIFTLFIP
jgi:hypothetical protein